MCRLYRRLCRGFLVLYDDILPDDRRQKAEDRRQKPEDRFGMKKIKGFLIDLDGVIYIEDQTIPGAVEAVNWLRRQGFLFRFLTNTTMRLAMIGDDIHMDVIGAQAVGMATILVRSGKYAFDAQKPLPSLPD